MKKERVKRRARRSFLPFLQYVWWQEWSLMIGRHTRHMAYEIDDAIDNYVHGVSTILDFEVGYRHGKSDCVSRALPAYYIGRFLEKNPDVIMTGYGASLIEGFSQDVKDIINSQEYRELFPMVRLHPLRNKVSEWRLDGHSGIVTCTGLGGALTGKGAGLLVIDDFLKSKEAARSQAKRDEMYNAVTDALTRLAPVYLVVICATSWHVDDPRQRMKRLAAEDPKYPKIRHVSYPAKTLDKEGKWTGEYLFEEWFGREWYDMQYATQGSWAFPLLDCNPLPPEGNLFKVKGIQIHEDISDFPDTRYIRAWDLASTKKERAKDDPDYTVGGLGTVTQDKFGFFHLWIKDCVWGQWEAPERDSIIRRTTKDDGAGVAAYVEAFGAYKDAYTTLKKILSGRRTVKKSRLSGDKVAKCAALEPIFEAGHVHLMKSDDGWNEKFIEHHTAHPEGTHDDFCLPADTKITCIQGDISIQDVKIGDYVMTRKGWKEILWSGQTGMESDFTEIKTTDGKSLIATCSHPVWDALYACWLPIDMAAINGMILSLNGGTSWHQKLSHTKASNIIDIQTQSKKVISGIFNIMENGRERLSICIEKYGKIITEKYQTVFRYIIKMATHWTTVLQTWNAFQLEIIGGNMRSGEITQPLLRWRIWIKSEQKHLSGINHQKEKRGTRRWPEPESNLQQNINSSAIIAEKSLLRKIKRPTESIDIARINAVTPVETNLPEPVYNLKVEGCHEFFANGILVHNCDMAAIIYHETTKAGTFVMPIA